MDAVLRHGSPWVFDSLLWGGLFLCLPALFAALGASLLQGSFLRILGGAVGGSMRDLALLVAVTNGWIAVSNPHWEGEVSAILMFFGACGGALGSCLAPYRGKVLLLNSAIGGFLGQFALPFVLLRSRQTLTPRSRA